MKFTLSWLKEHLDSGATIDALSECMTAIGLEVDSVEDPAKKLAPFTIAYVVEVMQHPNADKLRLCTVDTGSDTIQVVCGAPGRRTHTQPLCSRCTAGCDAHNNLCVAHVVMCWIAHAHVWCVRRAQPPYKHPMVCVRRSGGLRTQTCCMYGVFG